MKPKLSFMQSNEGFTISQDKYQPGWLMPYVHYHSYYEIYILEYGERLVEIGDSKFHAAAHTATFFGSKIPHKSTGTSAFGGICICFEESYLDKYVTPYAKASLLNCFKRPLLILTAEEYDKIKTIADSYMPLNLSLIHI